MKKLTLLTLPILLAACGGTGAPGGTLVTIKADKLAVNLSATPATSTTFTFINKAGSRAADVTSATLTWKDASGKTVTVTQDLSPITLGAGFTCAPSCGTFDPSTAADRTTTEIIPDATLFAKVAQANPGVKALPVTVQFNVTSNTLPFTVTP